MVIHIRILPLERGQQLPISTNYSGGRTRELNKKVDYFIIHIRTVGSDDFRYKLRGLSKELFLELILM